MTEEVEVRLMSGMSKKAMKIVSLVWLMLMIAVGTVDMMIGRKIMYHRDKKQLFGTIEVTRDLISWYYSDAVVFYTLRRVR